MSKNVTWFTKWARTASGVLSKEKKEHVCVMYLKVHFKTLWKLSSKYASNRNGSVIHPSCASLHFNILCTHQPSLILMSKLFHSDSIYNYINNIWEQERERDMRETREGRPACHMQQSLNHCIKVLLCSTELRQPMESFLWILHVRWTINMKYKLVEETNIQTCCDARGAKILKHG